MKTSLSRARVGAMIFIGVLTFVIGIFLVGEKSQLFSRTFKIHVNFTAAEGVKPGSFVVLSGYNIGTVTDIELSQNADSVRLTLSISEDVRRFIKADSKAEIKQEGLVGNKLINLLIGSPDLDAIQNNGYIQGVPPFALTSLADNVTAITDSTRLLTGELHRLVRGINRGEGTIGMLLHDDAFYTSLLSMSTNADQALVLTTQRLDRISEMLLRITRSIDAVVQRADTSVQQVNTVTGELTTLTRNINEGRGTVGALLNDRRMYDSLVTLIASLNNVAWDAGNTADQAAKSLYAMRRHWLFGRVFGGDEIDAEPLPESSYKRIMRELRTRAAELDAREQRLRALEQKLGVDREGSATGK
jgi:phospholipid/cholesterol/gamma-HCH transport system substrate-binding protein